MTTYFAAMQNHFILFGSESACRRKKQLDKPCQSVSPCAFPSVVGQGSECEMPDPAGK
jgi:hypothetical protein